MKKIFLVAVVMQLFLSAGCASGVNKNKNIIIVLNSEKVEDYYQAITYLNQPENNRVIVLAHSQAIMSNLSQLFEKLESNGFNDVSLIMLK